MRACLPACVRYVQDGEWAIRMLDSVRATASAAAPSLQAFAYGEGFVFFDGFKTIEQSTVVNVIIAASAVFLLMLLLLGHFMASIAVGVMVVMCDVGVLGERGARMQHDARMHPPRHACIASASTAPAKCVRGWAPCGAAMPCHASLLRMHAGG